MSTEKKTFRLGEKNHLRAPFRGLGGTFLTPYFTSSSQKASE